MAAERRAGRLGRLLGLLAGTLAGAAHGQGWQVTPSLSITETLTDNVRLSRSNPRSDLVTDLAPGLSIEGAGARGKLSLDYRLHELLYARDATHNRTQNALAASGTLEAVERWLFVDVRGNVSQQSVSAFGTQAPSDANVTDNRVETSTYRVSPYARWRFGDAAEAQLRYGWTETRSDSAVLTSARTEDWSASARSVPATAFTWSLDATRQQTRYGSGRRSEADRLRGVLGFGIDPQLRLSLIAGHEANDYASATKEGKATYGLGFDWSPDPATRVSGTRERRIFGNGHGFSLSHRTPLSSWKYTDSRDIQLLPSQFANQAPGTFYDLFDTMLLSSYPDPAQRATEVTRLLEQLHLPADATTVSGFLTSNAFVERRREASFALLGASNAITFAVTDDDRRALAASATDLFGDFASAGQVRQRGYSVDWSHKTSARSTLSLVASRLRSVGTGAAGPASTQRSLRLNFSTRIGPRTSLVLGGRRAVFDGTTSASYRENALLLVLSVSF